MPFLYHYTTKDGYTGIKGNFRGARDERGFVQENSVSSNEEPLFWTPNSEQPMKFTYGPDQKPKGFYLTELRPDAANNKELAKLGVNLIQGNDLYVFVFQVTLNQKTEVIGSYIVYDKYKSTHKFYITSKDLNGGLKIGFPAAVWCGVASTCPDDEGLSNRR